MSREARDTKNSDSINIKIIAVVSGVLNTLRLCLERLRFELANFFLRKRFVLVDGIFSVTWKFSEIVRNISLWAMNSRLDIEERDRDSIREFLLLALPQYEASEFQSLVMKKHSHPYDISESTIDEIWNLLQDRSLGQSLRRLIDKQHAVSDAIWDIRRCHGYDDKVALEQADQIWRLFAQNVPIQDPHLKYVFAQFLVDRLRPLSISLKTFVSSETVSP